MDKIYTEALFSYGTLQKDEVQMASFGRLLQGNADAMLGFRKELLEITDRDVLEKSGERFHPIVMPSGNPTDSVEGTVYFITPKSLSGIKWWSDKAF